MSRSSAWAALPKFRPGAFALFLIAAIASAVLADQPIGRELVLVPGAVWERLALWQPFTAIFVAPDGELGLLLGTLVIQWMIGSELEQTWSTRRYVAIVLTCALAGHLVSTLLAPLVPAVASLAVGGPTGIDLAAVAAFGVVFGKRPLRLFGAVPLSSRGLALLIAGVSIVAPLARGAPWPVVVPWLVSMALAVLLAMRPWNRTGGGKKRNRKPKHLRVVRADRVLN